MPSKEVTLNMSTENAEQFLELITEDAALRDKLTGIASFDEFVNVAQSMGYEFSKHELKIIIKENSEGVTMRRKTGIWPWLRQFSWL